MENDIKISQIDYKYSNIADFCKDLATKTTTDVKNNNVLITYYFDGLFGLDKIKTYANTNTFFVTTIDNILIEFKCTTFDEFKNTIEFYQNKALELKKELEEEERKKQTEKPKTKNIDFVECETKTEPKHECKCNENSKCIQNKKFSNEFLVKKLFENYLNENKDVIELTDEQIKYIVDKYLTNRIVINELLRTNKYYFNSIIDRLYPKYPIRNNRDNIFSVFEDLLNVFNF